MLDSGTTDQSFSLSDVTFGITSFDRPELLSNLVHSIKRSYPSAKIIVADNGRRKAILPADVTVFHLPFDIGLSATRNFLASKVRTRTMLLLEEDFLFLPTTRVEPLLDVLSSDDEVGVVGGAMMGGDGHVSAFSMDIDIFRDTMYLHPSRHRHRVTRRGTAYRICDVTLNFALFRRRMLTDHVWDERLKVGEHTPYFNELKKHCRWRVASCPQSVVYHVPDQRNGTYRKYRDRASRYFQQYLRRNKLRRCIREAGQRVENALPTNANVVVLGVGHSGTTILTRMLHHAGWQSGDADQQYAESVSIRAMNRKALRAGRLPTGAEQLIRRFPAPWAIKDPRFVQTLRYWLPIFAKSNRPPALLMIRRAHEDVVSSYQRRNTNGDIDAMVSHRQRQCDSEYSRWPWSKLTVQYEDIGRAARLFRPTASGEKHPNDLSDEGFPHEIEADSSKVHGDGSPGTFRIAEPFTWEDGSPFAVQSQSRGIGSTESFFFSDGSTESFIMPARGNISESLDDGSAINERIRRRGDDGSP